MSVAQAALYAGNVMALVGFAAFLAKLWGHMRSLTKGLQCLLRNQITEIYYRHNDEQQPTLREYERKSLDYLYAAYKALGGNSYIDDIYKIMRSWLVDR